MKRVIALIGILILSLSLVSCRETDNIISLVDDPTGYSLIETNYQCDYGEILEIYSNQSKLVMYVSGKDGYNGDIEIIVLIEDDKIREIVGYDIKETKDVGTKALEDNYLRQFIDIEINRDILVGGNKPNEDINILYVTGATFSSKAVLRAINTIILWRASNSSSSS